MASADAPPTRSSLEYYGILKGRTEQALAAFERLASGELKAFNELLAKEGLPTVLVAPRVDREVP